MVPGDYPRAMGAMFGQQRPMEHDDPLFFPLCHCASRRRSGALPPPPPPSPNPNTHFHFRYKQIKQSPSPSIKVLVFCHLRRTYRGRVDCSVRGISQRMSRLLPPQELSFEIGGFKGGSFLAWRRKGTFMSCRCTTVFTDGHWHHVVATLSYRTGTAKFYVNGTFISEKPGSETDSLFRTVPPSGGDILVGMGLSSSTSGVNVQVGTVSSIGLDDLRIHRRILSESEIHGSAWMLPPSAPHDSLALHWAFDDPLASFERDLSGNGANGLRGGIHNVPAAEMFLLEHPTPVSKPSFIAGADKGLPISRPHLWK